MQFLFSHPQRENWQGRRTRGTVTVLTLQRTPMKTPPTQRQGKPGKKYPPASVKEGKAWIAQFFRLGDPLQCVCGNTPVTEEFFVKYQDIGLSEPPKDEGMDRPLYQCDRCRALLDGNTGMLMGYAA